MHDGYPDPPVEGSGTVNGERRLRIYLKLDLLQGSERADRHMWELERIEREIAREAIGRGASANPLEL